MFTGQFWKETGSNVVKQFATIVVAFLVVDGAVVQQSITGFDWGHILGIAATAAVATVALSLATGTPSTPGLVSKKKTNGDEAGKLCAGVVEAVAGLPAEPGPTGADCSMRSWPTDTGWRIRRMSRR